MTPTSAYRLLSHQLGAYNALEADYVRSVAEAATYRQILLAALEELAGERRRAEALQERLHQIAGIVPWNNERNE